MIITQHERTHLLNVVNAQLADLDWQLYPDMDTSPPKMPWLMVIGAPRCGTTVLTQLLAYCFKAGYVNNVAARFWMAPVIGIRLGKEIVGSKCEPGFQSKHARTPQPINIHEFGRFWTRWLQGWYSDNPAPVPSHFNKMLTQMRAMMLEFPGRPFVAKGIYPAYMASYFKQAWGGKVVFVNITRPWIDTCVSIVRARLAKSVDGADWFGWKPPVSVQSQLLEKDMLHQVAGQLHYFTRCYHDIADVEVDLRDLCSDPLAVCEQVAKAAGLSVQRLPPHGTLHQYRDHMREADLRSQIRVALLEAGTWDWC